MVKAEIIADSVNEFGNRITTMVCTFPRYILAELNTHRMFSRNSASSRAIPFDKMVESVEKSPFIPMAWQQDHKGMQGTEYITNANDVENFVNGWLDAKDAAIEYARSLNKYGLTKQLCNRLLEPFMWHTAIITATEWENFFALRCPQYGFAGIYNGQPYNETLRSRKDYLQKFVERHGEYTPLDGYSEVDWLKLNKGQADIHMMALAEAMWDAYQESKPKELQAGQWHIPFGKNLDIDLACKQLTETGRSVSDLPNDWQIKIATARCARVSYTVVGEEGKQSNYENDIKLHDRLSASGHWSCFEHCAQAMTPDRYYDEMRPQWSGNFRGFVQYRKMFVNENMTK